MGNRQLAALTLVFLALFAPGVRADDPIRIEIGGNYQTYSNEELRHRVWQLERAVAQLQQQVFQLAVQGNTAPKAPNPWTCRIQSFGKTHIATSSTRSDATAQVLKKCGDATNPIQCSESNVHCGND